MIEMVQIVDTDGHVMFRAKGIVHGSPALLAEALGVSEDQLALQITPAQYAAVEKQRKRRSRKSADEAFWEHYHGHE